MAPKEDKIFAAFTECPLAPLEGVPTYEYTINLNVYLNLCFSAVNCTLGCDTLGYLVLTAHPAVFNNDCGMAFCVPTKTGIHTVMPNPTPTAALFFQTHQNPQARSSDI